MGEGGGVSDDVGYPAGMYDSHSALSPDTLHSEAECYFENRIFRRKLNLTNILIYNLIHICILYLYLDTKYLSNSIYRFD